MQPRRLRRRPAPAPTGCGKFVAAVVHPHVDPEHGAAAIAGRLADEFPPRRLLVVSFDRPAWQRALGLDGLAQSLEPLPLWWPDDPAYWSVPATPPLTAPLARRGLHPEHRWSGLGWRTTIRATVWRHPDLELLLAVCPPQHPACERTGRTEVVRVGSR